MVFHFIEDRSYVLLRKRRICQSNNSFKVFSTKNGFLRINAPKLLLCNKNLSGWFFITWSYPKDVSIKFSTKTSVSKENFSRLVCLFCSWRQSFIITKLFFYPWTYVRFGVENPRVCWSSIKQCSNLLRWRPNVNIWNIYIILEIKLLYLRYHFYTRFIYCAAFSGSTIFKLNIWYINWSIIIFLNLSKFNFKMPFWLCKINWTTISSNIPIKFI